MEWFGGCLEWAIAEKPIDAIKIGLIQRTQFYANSLNFHVLVYCIYLKEEENKVEMKLKDGPFFPHKNTMFFDLGKLNLLGSVCFGAITK